MSVKLDKRDKIFSKLVRERVAYNCEKCGRNFRHDPGYLECSHNAPRRHVATKWHPLCSVAHCSSCHSIFTDNPVLHTRWLDEYFGKALVDEMYLVAHTPVKWTKKMREEIHKHLLAEYKLMQERRNSGATGVIDFKQHPYMHEFGGSRPTITIGV